ncbi:MAG: HD domain-containing protein [Anaerolineae bacterium]
MADIERAIKMAVDAHMGQKDKAGAPYILHPLRVMADVEGEAEKIVAILHDVVEDTAITIEDLETEGFSDEICAGVAAMTKIEGESYDAYLQRVKKNSIAHRVKLADLKDNMNLSRLPELNPELFQKYEKYHRAWQFLTS